MTRCSQCGKFSPKSKICNCILEKKRFNKKIRVIRKLPEFAYFLGVLFGDGTISKDEHLMVFDVKDLDFINQIKDATERCFGIKIKIHQYIRKRNRPEINYFKTEWGWKFWICNTILAKYLNKITNHRKKIPAFIKYTPKLRRIFLSGFYDAEGSVVIKPNPKHLGRIQITQKGNILLNQIRQLLLSDNILASNLSKKGTGDFAFTLDSREDIIKFHKLIGFRMQRKQKKLRRLLQLKNTAIRIHHLSDDYWEALRLYSAYGKKYGTLNRIARELNIKKSTPNNWVSGKCKPHYVTRQLKYRVYPYDFKELGEFYPFLKK